MSHDSFDDGILSYLSDQTLKTLGVSSLSDQTLNTLGT